MLTPQEWRPRADAHAARVDVWVQPFLERRARGEKHPVEDFLFTYYSQRPAGLRRWHPGYGVGLLDAPEHADRTGYSLTRWLDKSDAGRPGRQGLPGGPGVASVTTEHLLARVPLLESVRRPCDQARQAASCPDAALPAPPGACTSATSAPPSWPGCSPAPRAAASCSGWRTSTPSPPARSTWPGSRPT